MFRIVPILLFVLTLWPVYAMAQNNPAYTVHDVKVDIVAESAVKARNQAFSAAQTQAFNMLAKRFLDAGQIAGFTTPDAATIAGMVSDFEITSEQLSKRRYLGTYIFRFKAGPVSRYFGHGPLSGDYGTTVASGNLLVLPVFSQNGQTSLWDTKKNPWLQAWQTQSGEPPLVIPSGDVSDVMDIRETSADKITQSGLKRMRARYGVNDIVILSAIFDQSAKTLLQIGVYRTDRGRIELVQMIPVPPGKAAKLGELLAKTVPQMKTYLAGDWKGQGQMPSPAPMMSAGEQNTYVPPAIDVQEYDNHVQDSITQIAPVAAQSGQVHVVTRFATMSDWLSIRRSLNGIAPLKSIRILGLTTNQVSMELIYSDWMALTSALSARGLSLISTGPGEYTLSKTTSTGYAR